MKIIAVVYRWPDGREEVRYRRPYPGPSASDLIEEVEEMERTHGDSCRYYYRIEPQNPPQSQPVSGKGHS